MAENALPRGTRSRNWRNEIGSLGTLPRGEEGTGKKGLGILSRGEEGGWGRRGWTRFPAGNQGEKGKKSEEMRALELFVTSVIPRCCVGAAFLMFSLFILAA